MESWHEDHLNNMLDSGLATYSPKEPPPGLEDRALARVHAASQKARLFRCSGAVAALAACALLAAVFLHKTTPPVAIQPPKPPVEISQIPLQKSLAAAVPSARPARHVRARHRKWPKQEIFPEPMQLTPEERALLAFARNAPKQAAALAAEASSLDRPIEIQPIQIKPLSVDQEKTQ